LFASKNISVSEHQICSCSALIFFRCAENSVKFLVLRIGNPAPKQYPAFVFITGFGAAFKNYRIQDNCVQTVVTVFI
jgi:hypothetical protein